jgi:hypothetical protein
MPADRSHDRFWRSRGLQSQPAEGLLTEAVLKPARIVPASSPTALASMSVCTALPSGASGRLAARRGRIGQSVKCGMGRETDSATTP